MTHFRRLGAAVGAIMIAAGCGGSVDSGGTQMDGAAGSGGTAGSIGGGSGGSSGSTSGGAGGTGAGSGGSGAFAGASGTGAVSGTGGAATGGTAGSGGAAAAGSGGSGGAAQCCASDASCAGSGECVQGWCMPFINSCWRDADCGPAARCQGASVCPCPQQCPDSTHAGQCEPLGCCTVDFDCGDAFYVPCVQGRCEQAVPQPQCWKDVDCYGGICVGAIVCPCGALCERADQPGQCAFAAGDGGHA